MSYSDKYKTIFYSSDEKETIIAELNRLAIDGNYVFRGYNKQEELLPGIIREKKIAFEENMLEDFERYGCHYFHAITPIDFMSYAQHFGIPTRLLDFTYNPFIALFFALFRQKGSNNSIEDDNEYYYIRFASLTENICLSNIAYPNSYGMLSYPMESLAEKACKCIESVTKAYSDGANRNISEVYDLRIREQEAKKQNDNSDDAFYHPKADANQDKFMNDAILFIDPNQANQRIIMQQGLFMFPYTLDKGKHMEIIQKNTKYIMIHKAHRNALLQYLDTMGYNTFRLNPDIGSICEAIRQKYRENRIKK